MSISNVDCGFLNEALPTFVSEAKEHTAMIEQLLLQLEQDPENRELLDALFRSAHTIKGSAGIFGLEKIVAFTHHVETLLDQMRGGQKQLTPELSTLLLRCNDEVDSLIAATQDARPDDPDAAEYRNSLVAHLREAYGTGAEACETSASASLESAIAPDSDVTGSANHWRVEVAFGLNTFRNGMDPLAIFNYIREMGEISAMNCSQSAVPSLEEMHSEDCYLKFDFCVAARVSREKLESAFSFVIEDCKLSILSLDEPTEARQLRQESVAPTPSQPGEDPQLESGAEINCHEQPGVILSASSNLNQSVLEATLLKQNRLREDRTRSAAGEDARFIRVQADRLDHVINLLGELVIASAGASLLARQSRQSSLIEANQQITSLVEEIRNGTLQLRMVPIGETFSRYRRVVRDTAAELGKDIVLDIVGGETEMDKSVVERISDPLMHLVRNALDHGLETPEQRLQAGKSAQGHLTLSACHESGSVLIRIKDDGAGIDMQKVLARARERGLVDTSASPTDAEIMNFLFEPGFSTAEKITNLSGRGVGMDVVRRNIEALRGSINVLSTVGQGSCMEIRLPLTLAIIDGFLISVGSSKFIFPLESVVEVIENPGSGALQQSQGAWIIELRGQSLPVVSLQSIYSLSATESNRNSVVVVRAGERRYGVMVDNLLGQHQTVIKPLGKLLRSLRGISGSSILGNGEVALILDVHALCQLAECPPAPPYDSPRAFRTEPHSQSQL